MPAYFIILGKRETVDTTAYSGILLKVFWVISSAGQ